MEKLSVPGEMMSNSTEAVWTWRPLSRGPWPWSVSIWSNSVSSLTVGSSSPRFTVNP